MFEKKRKRFFILATFYICLLCQEVTTNITFTNKLDCKVNYYIETSDNIYRRYEIIEDSTCKPIQISNKYFDLYVVEEGKENEPAMSIRCVVLNQNDTIDVDSIFFNNNSKKIDFQIK